MFVEPTYVKAIIELSNDQRLVFNYDKMVETLADDYRSYGNDEDPIETSMEWINTNIVYMGSKTPFIVYEKPIEGLDTYLEINGLDEELLPIEDAIIGITANDEVLIDADLSENFQSLMK